MSDGQWIERGTLDLWEERHREQAERIRELEANQQTLIAEAVAAAYDDAAEICLAQCDQASGGYLSVALATAEAGAEAIRACTPADAQAVLAARDKRVKQSVKPSERFHEEQVQIWAQEILEGLAMSDLIKIDTYDDKVTAHRIVKRELVDIGKALDILCHIHADDSGGLRDA